MKNRYSAAALAALLIASGCSSGPPRGPDRYRVKFETSKGDFNVEVIRNWSPLGADRFHELVKEGFYDGNRFFRIVPGFVVQWGIHGDPAVAARWENRRIPDDPAGMTNSPATICYATNGPESRTTQVFINLGNNARLDNQGFTPFGRVTEGMSVVASLYAGYGEGPNQGRIRAEGNAYLEREFPRLDYIKRASFIEQ